VRADALRGDERMAAGWLRASREMREGEDRAGVRGGRHRGRRAAAVRPDPPRRPSQSALLQFAADVSLDDSPGLPQVGA
jgi:hypothetical protein